MAFLSLSPEKVKRPFSSLLCVVFTDTPSLLFLFHAAQKRVVIGLGNVINGRIINTHPHCL